MHTSRRFLSAKCCTIDCLRLAIVCLPHTGIGKSYLRPRSIIRTVQIRYTHSARSPNTTPSWLRKKGSWHSCTSPRILPVTVCMARLVDSSPTKPSSPSTGPSTPWRHIAWPWPHARQTPCCSCMLGDARYPSYVLVMGSRTNDTRWVHGTYAAVPMPSA